MSYNDPDNRDVMRSLEKMQRQLDDIQKNQQQHQKLLSPEHIAQTAGYVFVQNELREVKTMLAEVLGRINRS